MKAQLHLKVCAYILALLGFWSVTLTEYFSSIWALTLTAMVIAGWFYEGPRRHGNVYRRIWLLLGLCLLLFFPFDVTLFGTVLLPAVHISMFVQAYFLFNPKNIAVYRRMFLVSFAQLLAATNLTTGIAFAVILTAYCITAVYGIVLMYLLRGLQMSDEDGFAQRDNEVVPQGLFVTAIVWTMVLLPLSLAFFYGAPRLRYALIARGDPIEALNQMQRARQRTGFTRTVQLGTFGRIQEDRTLAFRVEIAGSPASVGNKLRWRGGALNIYDGVAWSSSRDYFAYFNGKQWATGGKNAGLIFPQKNDLFITDERYAAYTRAEQLDTDPWLLKQVFYLEIPYSENIFGTGEIRAIQGPFTYGIGQDFNRSFYMNNRHALPEFISYSVYSMVEEPDETKLKEVPHEEFRKLIENEDHGSYVRTHYLQVPAGLNPRIRKLALAITDNAETPYEKVNAIENYLETQFTYSLDLGRPISDDPLYNFLFVSRTGHCEYFATAMTMMTRIIGMPSRLAKGFQKGEWNSAGGFYEVRQRDAHAWVEVFFPRYGWVAFDPSPRAAADEYFERQRSAVARALSKRFLLLQIQWRKYIVGYNETGRLRLFAEAQELLFQDTPGALAGLLRRLARTVRSLNGVQWIMTAIIAMALVAIVFAYRKYDFLPHLALPVRRSIRRRNGAAFYERMLNLLEKRKIVKPAHVTPLEFLDFPALRQHPMFTDIESLTSIYYRARFGGEELAHNETAAINDTLRRLKQSNGYPGLRKVSEQTLSN